MRINNLLIHRATVKVPGQQTGEDAYGRPIYSKPSVKEIKCRLDQLQIRTSVDAEGRDVIYSYLLFVGPDERLDMDTRVLNVLDENGVSVVFGEFSVVNIHPVYARRTLHHYELQLVRSDGSYGE